VSLLTLFVAFTYRAIPSVNKILNAVVHMHTYSFTTDAMLSVQGPEKPLLQPDDELHPSPLRFTMAMELRHMTFSLSPRKKTCTQQSHLAYCKKVK